MLRRLFNKFKSYINSPSALAINKNKYPIYRYGNRNIFWLIIEFLNLIKWMNIGILKYSQFNFTLNDIDKKTFIYACVFNSFSTRELIFFSKLNINKWYELKDLVPSNMIKLLNKKERFIWPNNCKSAIKVLNEKSKLYRFTPPKWRPNFVILNKKIINQLKETRKNQINNNWIEKSLNSKGIVIKPESGCKSKDIIIYKLINNKIYYKYLLNLNIKNKFRASNIKHIKLNNFFEDWKYKTRNESNAILMPYINNGYSYPESDPSAVFRVITKSNMQKDQICITDAWLEICFNNNIYFIDYFSKKLINIKPNQNDKIYQEYNINNWLKEIYLLKNKSIEICLEASKEMHLRIPPINKVAWDWIPNNNGPFLLEGNPNYSLLISQTFKLINNKA